MVKATQGWKRHGVGWATCNGQGQRAAMFGTCSYDGRTTRTMYCM
ncbi:hypothetical protein M3J09_013347 [Ascochyta lentis]